MIHSKDLIVTPEWSVQRLLESITLPSSGRYIDPCVGTGVIPRAMSSYDVEWTLLDIRDSIIDPCMQMRNFLTFRGDFDVCIMHPPASQASQFCRHARHVAKDTYALVSMPYILRTENIDIIRMEPDIYLLTDPVGSERYAWWHFGPHASGRIRVLDPTHASIRCSAW